ncbi:MAG: hypothetical protein HY695_06640 [Deltaproteobacteria bacterium]|nr:hypothetical protein [Deltaproteobacteria bacterium]
MPTAYSLNTVEDIREIFDKTYSAHYGTGSTHSGLSVEIISARIDAVGEAAQKATSLANFSAPQDPLKGCREVVFSKAGGKAWSPIYRGEALRPGELVSGGSIVEYYRTTVSVPPNWSATVDPQCNLRLKRATPDG